MCLSVRLSVCPYQICGCTKLQIADAEEVHCTGHHNWGWLMDDMLDERPYITSMSPLPGYSLTLPSTRSQLRNMIMNTQGLWTAVYGGHRFHAPQLEEKFPSLHLTVKQHMVWYVGRVQKLYPTLMTITS